ncbi:MAG: NADAR domain-containing protein [Dorea sp.]
MVNVCYAKFSQNKELKSILQATGEEELVENTAAWHDNVFGEIVQCERCEETERKKSPGKGTDGGE